MLALLALAGLLRPEAWAFSGLYWLYLMGLVPRLGSRNGDGASWRERPRARDRAPDAARRRRAADLGAQRPGDHRRPAVVADQHPAHRRNARPRDRHRQRARVHPAADRRDPAPARARSAPPLGGVLSLLWLRRRALLGAARRRARGGRVRRLRLRRAADQHPLRVPRLRDPVHLLRRRRVRLDAPAARRPAAALVDGRRRGRAASRCSPTPPRSTTQPTANWANSRASTRSKANCSRSSTTTPSTCAAARSACPTTRPCRCSRCTSKPAPATSSAPRPATSPPASTSTQPSKEVEKDYVLDPHDPVEKPSACRPASPSRPPTARG